MGAGVRRSLVKANSGDKAIESTLTLTPSSTALGSFSDAVPGVVELLHAVQGQDGAPAVVNDHVKLVRRALPERSLTPVVMVPV